MIQLRRSQGATPSGFAGAGGAAAAPCCCCCSPAEKKATSTFPERRHHNIFTLWLHSMVRPSIMRRRDSGLTRFMAAMRMRNTLVSKQGTCNNHGAKVITTTRSVSQGDTETLDAPLKLTLRQTTYHFVGVDFFVSFVGGNVHRLHLGVVSHHVNKVASSHCLGLC